MQGQVLTFPRILTNMGEAESLPLVIPLFEEREGYLSQEELWWAYYTRHREALLRRGAQHIPAVMARVYRTYPSLVRERHALLLLRDRGDFDWVLQDPKLDAAGVDYLIVKEGRAFGVHAYLATERGKQFREAKRKRHKDIGVVIDMPLEPEGGKKVGPFMVYGEQELNRVQQEVFAHLGSH